MLQPSHQLGVVIMDFSNKPDRILEFLKKRYSSNGSVFALDQPTFITHKRRATVFLGSDWKAGVKLCRKLKNDGYSVTLRVLPVPHYEANDMPGYEPFNYWPGRFSS
jgi:hypothetical protein